MKRRSLVRQELRSGIVVVRLRGRLTPDVVLEPLEAMAEHSGGAKLGRTLWDVRGLRSHLAYADLRHLAGRAAALAVRWKVSGQAAILTEAAYGFGLARQFHGLFPPGPDIEIGVFGDEERARAFLLAHRNRTGGRHQA